MVVFTASFCVILFIVGFTVQATLNYFWQKILRTKGMIDLQIAWKFYEKHKDSIND